MPRRAKAKLTRLIRRENVSIRELAAAIQAARRRVAILVHAAARDRKLVVSGRNREALYKRIGNVYAQLDLGLKDWGRDLVSKGIADWRDEAIQDVREQTGVDPSNEITRFSREYAEDVWKRVTPQNGRSLAAVFTEKMAQEDVRKLRQAAVSVFREASLSGMTANEIHKAIQEQWDLAAGDMAAFRFTDAAGRPWSNARYLQMLVRTTEARVARDAYFDALVEHGDDLVQIENVDGDACDICQAWDGVILSISGVTEKHPTYQQAMDAGWGHPNCRCSAERVDEDLDRAEIERQAAAETPDFEQREGETEGEYRRRMTEAVAGYSEGFMTKPVQTGQKLSKPQSSSVPANAEGQPRREAT